MFRVEIKSAYGLHADTWDIVVTRNNESKLGNDLRNCSFSSKLYLLKEKQTSLMIAAVLREGKTRSILKKQHWRILFNKQKEAITLHFQAIL